MKTVPTIYQPGVVPNEIYSGVPSFMGMPTAKTAEELKQYDFAVMGVPFEGGCTYGGFSSCVWWPPRPSAPSPPAMWAISPTTISIPSTI
ncbi:MAG: hypothetical protein ACLUJG_08710 [Lawsonibacter sp.]